MPKMENLKQLPFVREMIVEAVDSLNGQISNKEIISWINNNYSGINEKTIRAQIIVLTVNHESRVHYPEINKPRLTSSDNVYDFLFRLRKGEGVVERYEVEKHGVWEVYQSSDNKLKIRRQIDNLIDKVFTPKDIVWFKNVSNHLSDGAYLDITKDDFIIHFPNNHIENAKRPRPGEIMLIYQKLDGNKVFSHLVTPVNNELFDQLNNGNHSIGRLVRPIAVTNIKNVIQVKETLWGRIKLSGVTQGNACRIDNISGIKNPDIYRAEVWVKFKNFFVDKVKSDVVTSIMNEIELNDNSLTVQEGKLKLITHLVRERNREIIDLKKKNAIQEGKLFCEVCNFSFQERYGKDFIECHHINPIGTNNGQQTALDDLALVCANCHRMLHAKFGNKFLSMQELKKILKSGS